jgi:M6 family metalloprotease-like protein
MKKLNLFLVFALLIMQSTILHAVPAYPGLIKFTQPDGTKVGIYMMGDEFSKWAQSEDGYTLLYNNDGYLEYAKLNSSGDIVPSGIKATDIRKRNKQTTLFLKGQQKNMKFSPSQIAMINQIKAMYKQEATLDKAFPTSGNRKLICILIGYTDLAFTKTQAEFNNLFNQINYSVGGATGSVKDFYLENSYGQFNLTVDVAGPFTASQNMAYYGANNTSGNDVRPRELVTEAINLADPTVDFSLYDNDNDGWVDGIYIIYAGYGEEAGGGANCIWAHAWSLSSAITKDGVQIQRYSCSAELRGNSGSNITHIGVICHEFGHVLGAPDYYDTNYSTGGQFSGTGNWDMMASGSWNNSGATPAHHNGFTKVVYYNWAPVTVLNSPTTVTLENSAQYSNSFYRINTATAGEYYFIENREKHLFDAFVPGSGLLIYHVHSTVLSSGSTNTINTTHPQKMYPVAQNATSDPTSTPSTYGTINTATCAWTGSGTTKTEFSDASIPSMKSWAVANTGKPITNISRNSVGKTVTFDFMGGVAGNPSNFTATGVSMQQINLSWQLNSGNDVLIAWSPNEIFGTPVDGTSYFAGNSIPGGGTILYKGSATSFNHTGLNANTTYYYKVWSIMTGTTYSTGIMNDARTLCDVVSALPFAEGFDNTTIPNCWNIVDNIGNGQVWQFGTGGGLIGANGNYAFLNSDAYGSNNSQNSDLVTPTLDLSAFSNITLTFQHYFRSYAGSAATLAYSLNNGATWTTVQTWTATTTNPVTFNQVIPALSGQSQVKIKWNYTGSYGYYWSIEDVAITGSASCPVPTASSAGSVSQTSAVLSWTQPGSVVSWDIELGVAGFNATGVPTRTGVTNNYVYSGLTSGTNYQYYIRSYCNPYYSDWTGPYYFTTLCETITNFPFSESFDGVVFEPACWMNQKTSGTGVPGTWDRQTSGTFPTCSPKSGAGMARFNSYTYTAGTVANLVTPALNLQANNDILSFWMMRENGSQNKFDRINIYINSAPNTTGATLLGTIHRSRTKSPTVSTNAWYQYSYTVPAGYTGIGYFVFEAIGDKGNNIFIDDIVVTRTNNCAAPSGLAAGSITTNSAELSWISGGSETSWDIELDISGFTPTGNPTRTNIIKPYNYTGLNMNTNYSYYVRAKCGGTNSAWSGPMTFKTECTTFEQTENYSICQGESYLWRGTYYSAAGTYYNNLQNAYGCDSTYVLNLVVYPTETYTTNADICQGTTYTWMGNTYSISGTYFEYGQTQNGCQITYQLNLVVHPVESYITNAAICDESSYTWMGNTYSTTGTYYEYGQTQHGCQITYQLNLVVHPTESYVTNASICEGNTYNWMGNNYSVAGTYFEYGQTLNGCQITYILNLTLNSNEIHITDAEICEGSTFTWMGNTYLTTGTYYEYGQTQNGCQITYQLNLVVHPTENYVTNAAICEGNTYTWMGNAYSTAGTYYEYGQTPNGCQITYELNLVVHPTEAYLTNASICEGSVYTWMGNAYSTAGTYYEYGQTPNGCQITYELNLVVHPTENYVTNAAICEGNTYTWMGNNYSTAGTYYEYGQTPNGCQITYELNLVVHPTENYVTNAAICEGNTYTWMGNTYSLAGTYYEYGQTQYGCEITFILYLTINNTETQTSDASICEGNTYTWMGNNYSTTGTYYEYGQTQNGCQITYELNLVVHPTEAYLTNASICEGSVYTWMGNAYSTAGTYYEYGQTPNGCQITYELNLVVHPTEAYLTNASICEGSVYTWMGNNYSTAGTYFEYGQTPNGCQITYELNLVVHPTETYLTNASICEGSNYTWMGNNYSTAGTYYEYGQTPNGCQITYELNLVVHPTETYLTNASICEGSNYTWMGNNYSTAGTYYEYGQIPNGCQITYELNLVVHPTENYVTNAAICEGNTYTWMGNNYSTAGTYFEYGQTPNGCQITYELNLVVHPTETYLTNASICEGSWMGNNYTWMGCQYIIQQLRRAHIFEYGQTPNGCQITYELNLVVHPTETYLTNASICEGSNYTWMGNNYSTAGTYYEYGQTPNGCQITYQLNLVVHPTETYLTNASICEGSNYTWMGNNYSTAGTYYEYGQTPNGCQITYQLNLVVHPTETYLTNASICEGSNYTLDG